MRSEMGWRSHGKPMRASSALVLLPGVLLSVSGAAQTLLSDENAYNPVPSPDGRKIAAVRTGWGSPGGSGGFGRSNIVSEVIVLDREAHVLSPKTPVDGFVAQWTAAGIVAFRDWSYEMLSPDGVVLRKGRVCGGVSREGADPGCSERVAYLASIHQFVSVFQKFGDSTLMTGRKDLSTHHRDQFLGEWIVPSPDERYIAVGPARLGMALSVYDLRGRAWIEFGGIAIHPDPGWYWMEPSWSPWFADSSQLAYFSGRDLVVSSADGRRKRVVARTDEPAGLAVPSPDGRAIAYATFRSRPRTGGGGNTPIWNCTGLWVVGAEGSGQPRRLTGETTESTSDLRWLDDRRLVFDRIQEGVPPRARIWTVDVAR